MSRHRRCRWRGGRRGVGGWGLLGELRPLGQEPVSVETMTARPGPRPGVRVRGVGDGPGLNPGLITQDTIVRSVLGDPGFAEEVVGGVGDDDDMLLAALAGYREDNVAGLETTIRVKIGVLPGHLLEAPGLQTFPHIACPEVINFEQSLVPPGDAKSVMQTIIDGPAHQAGAVGVLWALDVPLPVRLRVPRPSVGLAISHILHITDTARDAGCD